MTSESFSLPPADDALETLVNEVVDAESQGEDARALELIRKGVAEFPGFGARLAATRAAIKSLRQPVFVPDQRVEVLTEVDYLRPFLSPRIRKQISATRVAIAAGLVLTASLLMTLQYLVPQVTPRGPQPEALSGVVEASRADAAASVRSLASVVDEFRNGIEAPVENVMRPRGRLAIAPEPLRLGSSNAYEADLRRSIPHSLEQPKWILSDPTARVAAGETGMMERLMAQRAQESTARRTGLGRLDGTPLLLPESLNRNASVRTQRLIDRLEVDADGVVLFDSEDSKNTRSEEPGADK